MILRFFWLLLLMLLWTRGFGEARAGSWKTVSLPQKPGQALYPKGIAVDSSGDLYVADIAEGGRVQKRDAAGNWILLASSGSGLGQTNLPQGLALDAAGSLYVADNGSKLGRIQKRDATGIWSVLAEACSDSLNCPSGRVYYPSYLAVDGAGALYVSDIADNGRIQKRDAQGIWSEIAIPCPSGANCAPGSVYYPAGLAVDAQGRLLVADEADYGRIQVRDAKGYWSLLSPSGTGSAPLRNPAGLSLGSDGVIYVSDYGDDRIMKRDAKGNWTTLSSACANYASCLPSETSQPQGIAVDTAGNLYVADWGNEGRARKRDLKGDWSVLASIGRDPGQFGEPTVVTASESSEIYVIDGEYDNIQKRDAAGSWSLLASACANPSDCPTGSVASPVGLAVDRADNLYVAEGANGGRIQKRDAKGNWSVIASACADSLNCLPGQLLNPDSFAADATGDLYIADDSAGWGRIQKRDAAGNWTILPSGSSSPLWYPYGLATDGSGDLIVADKGDGGRIQKRDAAGSWMLIAKTDSAGIAADSAGSLYYLSGSALILKIDLSNNLTVISLDPGRVYGLKSIAVDDAGELWVADATNYRILQYDDRPEAVVMKGDLNGDGKIDVRDASLLLRIVIGSLAPTSAQEAAGDANGDGALNVQDVTALLQAIAGIRKIG